MQAAELAAELAAKQAAKQAAQAAKQSAEQAAEQWAEKAAEQAAERAQAAEPSAEQELAAEPSAEQAQAAALQQELAAKQAAEPSAEQAQAAALAAQAVALAAQPFEELAQIEWDTLLQLNDVDPWAGISDLRYPYWNVPAATAVPVSQTHEPPWSHPLPLSCLEPEQAFFCAHTPQKCPEKPELYCFVCAQKSAYRCLQCRVPLCTKWRLGMFDGQMCRLPCHVLYHFSGAITGGPSKLGNRRRSIRVSEYLFDRDSVRWLLRHFMTSIREMALSALQVPCLLCGTPTLQACMACLDSSCMPAPLCWNESAGKDCFLRFHLMAAEERQSHLCVAACARAAPTWDTRAPLYRLPGGAA
jgi:hypothetical protein